MKPLSFNTQFNITLPYKPRIVEHGPFLSESQTQILCAVFIYTVYCCILTDLILYSITLRMFDEDYKL
jgi:hypothetical protein